MTIDEARKELRQYRFLCELKIELKSKLSQLNSDYNSLNSQNSIYVDGGERNYGKITLLDKIHIKRLELAKAIYDTELQAILIRSKISKMDEPYSSFLMKRFLEFKNLNKISRELHLSNDRVKHISSEAVIKYSIIES